ncbi:guanylate cyclase 32E-like [Tachypleus tridentatus]|uniref:guanylate cyclase 32E-like n=1 Tax=Tachypleus tridentatus TaxID=6853 RepID=UPI003FD582B3
MSSRGITLREIMALSLLILVPVPTNSSTFTMGYLTGSKRRPGNKDYPRYGLTISGAISLAVDEVNRDHPLRDNHTLEILVAETYGEETESILQTAKLWTQNVSVYIGPQETCVHEARMAASFDLPMISYFCAHHETSNKQLFPTFARTRPPDTQISKSVSSLLLYFKWKKVAFLYSVIQDRGFREVARTILETIKSVGIEIQYEGTWSETYHYGYGINPFDKLVEESYGIARIFLVLGYYFEHLGLMISLQDRGLLENGEYFVVGVDIEQYDNQDPRRYLKGLLRDEIEDKAKTAFQSYLGVVGSPPMGFESFAVKVNQYMQLPPFNFKNPVGIFGGMKRVPAEGAYLYDAVYVYARALNDCLADGQDPFDGKLIFDYMKRRTYQSAMGYMVYMDENGDAEGNYTVVARKPLPGVPGEFGIFRVGMFMLPENSSGFPVLYLEDTVDWVGDGPPKDGPECGFQNEKCISFVWRGVAGGTGGVALVLLIILWIVYRNWSYERELDNLLWKIDYKDIQVNEYTPTTACGKTPRSLHPVIRTSQVSLSSNPESDFRYSTIYTQIGIYRGRICAIKRLRKKCIDITRKMKKEMKTIRDLQFDNLNPFVGACVDPPNICIITEYCSRGSLKDILENEDVKLDNMFIASLVGDIVRGMIFLHDSSIRSHGNLKSSNCLVDSRWVVKITDFGLHELKSGTDLGEDSTDLEKQCERFLWRAPELLRNPDTPPCGTQKGDVYSFAIILYEVLGRNGPYGKIDMTPSEIIKRVMQRESITPFRPQLELLENVFDCARDCMKECWSEDFNDRPDFKTIRAKLRPMRKGMKPNIFDNMLVMMEKYANNLEALVDERTDLLIEEKKKTEALLYEMLPRYVAEQLKRGNKVKAESFDCVTIYFSDIVGFTTMSAESSPLQVVDFLNDLYTCFDSIIENYDVYKVETIGDAYMVVSGLPIRNGDQHAGEIASMALQLLDAVRKFTIRHRPNETLMLRIGIHSGPVCAGVVGLKMPRYCLFGDTVNTASRMESTGLPLKIHCSSECREILEKLGGYHLEERGVICIKGKGELKTFWLSGEEEHRRCRRRSSFRRNGCLRSPRNSLRKKRSGCTCQDRRMSLESPKKLRFANSESRRKDAMKKEMSVNFDDVSCPNFNPFTALHLHEKQQSCPCLGPGCMRCLVGDKQTKDPYFLNSLKDGSGTTFLIGSKLLANRSIGTREISSGNKFRFPPFDKKKALSSQSESEPFLPKLLGLTGLHRESSM